MRSNNFLWLRLAVFFVGLFALTKCGRAASFTLSIKNDDNVATNCNVWLSTTSPGLGTNWTLMNVTVPAATHYTSPISWEVPDETGWDLHVTSLLGNGSVTAGPGESPYENPHYVFSINAAGTITGSRQPGLPPATAGGAASGGGSTSEGFETFGLFVFGVLTAHMLVRAFRK